MTSDVTPAYVGCIVAVTVARPEWSKQTARDVAAWIRDGLTVTSTTVDGAKADPAYFRDCGGPRHARRAVKPAPAATRPLFGDPA